MRITRSDFCWVKWCRSAFGIGGELLVLIHTFGLFFQALLIGLKVDGHLDAAWTTVMIPMFFATAATGYTLLVAAARLARERGTRYARKQSFFGLAQLCNALIFVFFLVLALSLEAGRDTLSRIVAPLISMCCCILLRFIIR